MASPIAFGYALRVSRTGGSRLLSLGALVLSGVEFGLVTVIAAGITWDGIRRLMGHL